MFNQCTPTFAGQTPFTGFNGFQPTGFTGFPFAGTTPWNGFTGVPNFQGWQGQNWMNQNWNSPNAGTPAWNTQGWAGQNFDWNAFSAGCFFGFQNACAWIAGQTTGQNSTQFTGQPQAGATPGNQASPTGCGPFGFFPYGPFNFAGQNANQYGTPAGANGCTTNPQAA